MSREREHALAAALEPITASGWGCAVDQATDGRWRATVYAAARQPVTVYSDSEIGAALAAVDAMGLAA